MNMKLSLSTFILIIFIVFLSIFFANISNLIAVHVDNKVKNYDFGDESTKNLRDGAVINDESKHLLWFIQISDLHVSIFEDESRVEQLREFCRYTVPAISPAVVLASGDLTDAKTIDNVGSSQQLKEWQIYHKILQDYNVTNVTTWLDIRGNHDNFNIPDEKSKFNYYKKYTVQGPRYPHSYIHILDFNGDRYAFLGIDACLSPGPKRPFNFIGFLSPNETNNIKQLIKLAQGSDVQYTVAFGHYPTSCIISQGSEAIRKLVLTAPGGYVYLCGHLHMAAGLIPNMYALQKTGMLELELADWKENRMFRLAAFDHGLFSFTDIKLGSWPIILVTNPKNALYIVPGKENPQAIVSSTHIRILVFSLSPIEVVQVSIDDGEWLDAEKSQGHPALYTLPWTPSHYQREVHNIHVRARDSMTREHGISQQFSLDGSRVSFGVWPRIVLMSNINLLFQSLFGLGLCAGVVPLCAFRVAHALVVRGQMNKPIIRNRMLRRWTRQLWLLSSIDRIFYPIVLYPIYLSVGPWMIGEVIDGHVGAIFAWGIWVNNSFLPGSFTYAYGFLHICLFQLPLTLILAHDVEKRFQQLQRIDMLSTRFWHHVPFYILVLTLCFGAYFFWLAYGTLGFILGPLRTWAIPLALFLWYQANILPKSAFRTAVSIWEAKPSDAELES